MALIMSGKTSQFANDETLNFPIKGSLENGNQYGEEQCSNLAKIVNIIV